MAALHLVQARHDGINFAAQRFMAISVRLGVCASRPRQTLEIGGVRPRRRHRLPDIHNGRDRQGRR